MANDINKEDPHYKGEYGSIYEVNRKFPTGGVAGDFVVIYGWAHYWNAARGTWCVNAERDSYWDELITNIIEKFKLVRGATYMGVASLDTVPTKVIGVKMYYFATVAGTYKNFDNLVVPQGINVLYSDNGSSWVNTTLLEVAQELGVSTNKVVSQKTLNDALAKKLDKESVVQESGEAEDKVISQKTVSNKLSDLEKKIGDRFVVEGDVTNLPDEEDLTNDSQNRLKFANRSLSSKNTKGFKILREDDFSFYSSDTIYLIKYNFDFGNKTITLPENSILCFEGGSFSNVTLKGSNTTIQAQNYEIFKNVTLTGTWDTADFYVEWFGAKGDGVNDDTTSIQKALDVVLSVTLPFHITVHLFKTYRITDTLNIHAETTLKGNFIGSYMNYAKTQYKCIVADFSDTKKWVVQSSNLKNSAYNANIGKNPVDSGTIKYQEAIRIEDVKIESSNTNNPVFGGIRIIASSNSSIKNCSVFHTRYGIYRMATWYSSDSDNFVISLICPLVMGYDMNAFSVINGYYNCSTKVLDGMYNEENMLAVDTRKYKKNILTSYARGTIINAITEHADCARIYIHSRISDIGGWIEACSSCYEAFQGTTLTIIEPHIEANATTHFIREYDSCSVHFIGGDSITSNVITKSDIWSGYTRVLNNYSRKISSVQNNFVGLTLFSRIDKKMYWWNGEFWGDYVGFGIQTKYSGEFNDIPYEHKLKNGSIYMCANSGKNIPIFQSEEGNFPYVKLNPSGLSMASVVNKNIPFKITLFDKTSITGTLIYKKEYDSYDYTYQILKRVAESRNYTVGTYTILNPDWKGGESDASNLALIRTDTGESLVHVICTFQYFAPKKQSYVDALGFRANLIHRGTTAQRPTPTASDEGFEYYDSTLKKKILWNGTKWVNIDGTAL